MKKLSKFILLFVLLIFSNFLIQSCAVSNMPTSPMKFNKDTSEKGLLIGSVTFPKETPRFNGYFFRLTGNKSDEFMLKPGWKHKGQLDEGRTYLFAIERPVGVSEIPSVRLFHNSGMIAGQYDLRIGAFSIPYEIKKGEITYIGNIIFNEYAEKWQKVISLNNNFQRDINALKKLQPSIDWDNAKNDESRKIEYNTTKAKL